MIVAPVLPMTSEYSSKQQTHGKALRHQYERPDYALLQLSKKIPDDFELISFDQPYIEGVSYISQDEEQIARKAVDLLLTQISGNSEPTQVRVPSEFVDISAVDDKEKVFHMLYVLNRGTFSV